MAISSPGLGSGLDVNGIVTQLMQLERRPLNALDRQEASYQARLTTIGTLKGALSALQTPGGASASANGPACSASSSNSAAFTASALGTASPGSHSIDVDTLAQSEILV